MFSAVNSHFLLNMINEKLPLFSLQPRPFLYENLPVLLQLIVHSSETKEE